MTREEELLRLLATSELFAPDFPRRPRFDHATSARLTPEERREAAQAYREAERRVPNFQELQGAISELGRAEYAPVIPLLIAIWRDCPMTYVRAIAGIELRDFDTPETRAALAELLDDASEDSVHEAVLAIVRSDPANAYDRFASYLDPARIDLPECRMVADDVVSLFAPVATLNGKLMWRDPDVPEWFAADPRWRALLARLLEPATLRRALRLLNEGN